LLSLFSLPLNSNIHHKLAPYKVQCFYNVKC
jgi:hypothetical protein